MKQNLTNYTDRELSLIVLNDEGWYNMIGSEGLLEAIDDAFIYTDEQMEDLLELLEAVSEEKIKKGYIPYYDDLIEKTINEVLLQTIKNYPMTDK